MRIQHIIAIIYVVVLIIGLFEQPIVWWAIGVCILIIVMMCAMARWLDHKYMSHLRTMDWLMANHQLLTERPEYFTESPFPNTRISKNTKLRSFEVVTSLLVVTMDEEVEADLRPQLTNGLIATLWTLTFGWWALPWGPYKTIRAILINITGGKKTTIAKCIDSQKFSSEQ